MRCLVACFGGILLSLVVAAVGTLCEGSEVVPTGSPTLDLRFPFQGPGQLVMVVSRGWPPNDHLVVVTPEGARLLGAAAPWRNPRWRSPREIVVRQSGPGWSGNIVRMDSSGKILATITDGYFVEPQPAPDGRRLMVAHVLHDGGVKSLEIRDLEADFRLLTAFSPDELPIMLAEAAWAPDGEQLVVAVRSNDSDIGEHLQSRLAIVSPNSGTTKRLYHSRKDRKRDPRGIVPMFWLPSGIYAWSARGVLRCDPEGKGCDVVYNPGEARHVIGGTAFGGDEALLLVADVKADPLEPRAKEIHRLNLSTGKGELWLRMPDDVFVSDIDWIGDPDPKGSDPSAPS